MKTLSGLSIVIPAFNEEKFLPETISSIKESLEAFSSHFDCPSEIIVVDNGSTDSTTKVASDLGTRVIQHEVRNIASVRNKGIKSASYNLVVTVDADSYVPIKTFTEIGKAMMRDEYVGGAVRLGIRSQKLHLRILVLVIEQLTVLFSGLSGGLFFFDKDSAIKIGGFPESHLIAEDMAFAKTLKSYGKTQGKMFLNLRSVTVLTFDRKDVSFLKTLQAFWQGFKAALGMKLSKKDLDYWYKPRR